MTAPEPTPEPGLKRYIVYGFPSTHDALEAETALKRARVEFRTIPTPASLGARCGIALRVPSELERASQQALRDAGCLWSSRVPFMDR